MSKQLQVLLDEEEYLEIQGAARRQRETVAGMGAPGIEQGQGTTTPDLLKQSSVPSPMPRATGFQQSISRSCYGRSLRGSDCLDLDRHEADYSSQPGGDPLGGPSARARWAQPRF